MSYSVVLRVISTIYNMSGRVVSADTNSSRRREFVCPIQHGREVYAEMIKVKVYVNQQNSVS